PYTFAASDFYFADSHDVPPNHLLAVKVATLPAAGQLTDNAATVMLGQFVPAADITGGKLVFTPAAGGMGQPYEQCDCKVQDDGGIANGGSDLSASATLYLNVGPTGANHAPSGTDKVVSLSEDRTYTFSAADFPFGDAADFPPNNFLAVKIA